MQTLFDFISKNTKLEIAKIMVQELNTNRVNVSLLATYNENVEILPTFYKCIQKILTTEEIKKMWRARNSSDWNVLHYAAQCCNDSRLKAD